jgi:hypothetical protein
MLDLLIIKMDFAVDLFHKIENHTLIRQISDHQLSWEYEEGSLEGVGATLCWWSLICEKNFGFRLLYPVITWLNRF